MDTRAPVTTRRRRRSRFTTYLFRTIVTVYLFLLVAWPVGLVVKYTFQDGFDALRAVFDDPDTRHALALTVRVAVVSVAINLVFGVGLSILLVRYRFPGRRLLSALIDLPLAVSPVVVGLALLLVYNSRTGWFGPTLDERGLDVIFATPGIVFATVFVSLPLVIRELVPVLEEIGIDQEQAARSLGANSWQTFWRITLPSIRWGVTYGVVLATARALGEFGAVAVVSGRISGSTETMPLYLRRLFDTFNVSGAYAAAVVLALLALTVLFAMNFIQRRDRAILAGPSVATEPGAVVPHLDVTDDKENRDEHQG